MTPVVPKILRITGAIGIGLAIAVVGTAMPASAASKDASCSTGGGILSIGTEYNLASQSTIWVTDTSFTIERNGGSHNNVYLRVRKGDGTDIWAWTSGDDVRGGNTQTHAVGKRIPQSSKPYMKGNAIFDVSGNDPNCSAYITY